MKYTLKDWFRVIILAIYWRVFEMVKKENNASSHTPR